MQTSNSFVKSLYTPFVAFVFAFCPFSFLGATYSSLWLKVPQVKYEYPIPYTLYPIPYTLPIPAMIPDMMSLLSHDHCQLYCTK